MDASHTFCVTRGHRAPPTLVRLRLLRIQGRAHHRLRACSRKRARSTLAAGAEETTRAKIPCTLSPTQLSITATSFAAVQELVSCGELLVPVCAMTAAARTLRLHFVGVDIMEGTCIDGLLDTLLPCLRAIHGVWSTFDVLCCGPGLHSLETRRCPVLKRARTTKGAVFSVVLRVACGMYHDIARQSWFRAPDVAFMYNPGFWGYDSWQPTLEYLRSHTHHPCISTAYNLFEAEDDEDTLEEVGLCNWVWGPEANRHRSTKQEQAQPPMYRELFSNNVWCCFRGCKRHI